MHQVGPLNCLQIAWKLVPSTVGPLKTEPPLMKQSKRDRPTLLMSITHNNPSLRWQNALNQHSGQLASESRWNNYPKHKSIVLGHSTSVASNLNLIPILISRLNLQKSSSRNLENACEMPFCVSFYFFTRYE